MYPGPPCWVKRSITFFKNKSIDFLKNFIWRKFFAANKKFNPAFLKKAPGQTAGSQV